jgi:DNA-binding CsgD family transcriptional regulator
MHANAGMAPDALVIDDMVILRYPVARSRLTGAEREVIACILAGLSNAQIARARRTSVRTVANQIAGIFKKTGARSRAEIATAAVLFRDGV